MPNSLLGLSAARLVSSSESDFVFSEFCVAKSRAGGNFVKSIKMHSLPPAAFRDERLSCFRIYRVDYLCLRYRRIVQKFKQFCPQFRRKTVYTRFLPHTLLRKRTVNSVRAAVAERNIQTGASQRCKHTRALSERRSALTYPRTSIADCCNCIFDLLRCLQSARVFLRKLVVRFGYCTFYVRLGGRLRFLRVLRQQNLVRAERPLNL